MWEQVDRDGYWFANNGWSVGEWCADHALEPLGIARDEAFPIPQTSAGCFAIDVSNPTVSLLLDEWHELAMNTDAFKGPWTNGNNEASSHPRVRGHRHDQTAISVLIWRHGLHLTPCPLHYSYYEPPLREQVCLAVKGI